VIRKWSRSISISASDPNNMSYLISNPAAEGRIVVRSNGLTDSGYCVEASPNVPFRVQHCLRPDIYTERICELNRALGSISHGKLKAFMCFLPLIWIIVCAVIGVTTVNNAQSCNSLGFNGGYECSSNASFKGFIIMGAVGFGGFVVVVLSWITFSRKMATEVLKTLQDTVARFNEVDCDVYWSVGTTNLLYASYEADHCHEDRFGHHSHHDGGYIIKPHGTYEIFVSPRQHVPPPVVGNIPYGMQYGPSTLPLYDPPVYHNQPPIILPTTQQSQQCPKV
jgi:hypothetical protein